MKISKFKGALFVSGGPSVSSEKRLPCGFLRSRGVRSFRVIPYREAPRFCYFLSVQSILIYRSPKPPQLAPRVTFPGANPGNYPGAGVRESLCERDYRAFFESGGTGNVIADLKTGRFVEVNDAFCALTGYSRPELHLLSALDITHPDDRQRDMQGWLEAVARGDRHYAIDKRYIRRDGLEIRVSVISTLIRNGMGEPLHAAGSVFEKTSPAPAEMSVASGALQRIGGPIIDASPVAVIALDQSRRVEVWNPEAARLFGLSDEETRGHRLLDLPLKWRSPDALDALLEMPSNEHAALSVDTPHGHSLEVSVWCAPYSQPDGSMSGRVLLVLDETEKNFLERALLDSGEHEQRRIGQELHEGLCQQLMGAAFVAQALSRELDRDQSPCAERAGNLARLLSDSVLQGRNLARGLNPVEIDPAGLMSALQEFAERLRTGAHIELRCEKTVLVHSAEAALHIFRIAQEASAIALRLAGATRVLIRLVEMDGNVVLQVSDNGSSERDAGVGLGIMRYRVQAVRGDLAIESAPGSGTTITCTFPNS
jgi:PAS domain S-box-containing protein